jgi:PIN domain nuclease of toxin-antitoxin system
MRLLPDTHVLAWWFADDRRLGGSARAFISHPATQVMVSAASAREMAIRHKAAALAWPHCDPFDRMLAAQAQLEGARIVTADPALPAFLGDGVAA